MLKPTTAVFSRDRLIARLDGAADVPVRLLVASAGSGKSSAVRAYLAARHIDSTWYDAAPEHASPAEFLRGFALALADVSPAMIRTAGGAAAGDDDDALTAWAAEHLRDVQRTIVLDGLHHVLGEPRVAALVRGLVDATIPRVRWILVTRDASSLPVARWLANRVIGLPVDDDDLRVEFRELVEAATRQGALFALDDLERLHARTAGWPLGLAVALAEGAPDAAEGRDALYDAVVDAALAAAGHDAREGVYAAALAGRFDAALFARLADDRGATREALVRHGLVYRVGDTEVVHEQYRVRLIAHARALGARPRGTLVARVAAALEASGRWSDAVGVLLEGDDGDAIAAALDRRGFAAIDQGETALVQRALAVVGEDVLTAYPMALAMKAALASLGERLDLAEAWFRMAIDAAADEVRREIVIRYGLDLVRRQRPDVVPLLETEAAHRIAGSAWDAALWGVLATAYVAVKRMDDARRAAQRALGALHAVADDAIRGRVLHQAAYVALNDHDYGSAKDLAERAYRIAQDAFLYDLAARALSVLYVLAIDVEDDAAAARRHLLALAECARKSGSAPLRIYAALNLYELETLAADTAALERLDAELRELEILLTPLASETMLPAQALRAAWDGRFEQAYALLAPSAEKQFDDDRRAQRWAEAAMYAAAAGMRREASLAMRASRTALRKVEPSDRWAMRSQAFLAVAEVLLGHDGRARSALVDLHAAARGAGTRFAALVDAIAALHERWLTGWCAGSHLGNALERLDQVELGGIARFLGALPIPSSDRARAGSLTDVEKLVLARVAAGATSKEIAAMLDRSPQTIDVHIRSICKKLGVSGRRQAVAFAIREGLVADRLPA